MIAHYTCSLVAACAFTFRLNLCALRAHSCPSSYMHDSLLCKYLRQLILITCLQQSLQLNIVSANFQAQELMSSLAWLQSMPQGIVLYLQVYSRWSLSTATGRQVCSPGDAVAGSLCCMACSWSVSSTCHHRHYPSARWTGCCLTGQTTLLT